MNKIDLVYVIGTGSSWANNELRYSLRSVVENLKGYRNIYVIGEKPVWIDGIRFIQYPDRFEGMADANITMKVLRACAIPELSENFLFINDDHLIMKPVFAAKIPCFHKGEMRIFKESYFANNVWRHRLKNTRDILIEKDLPARHFDCHTPIVFNKKKFVEVFDNFDFTTHPGYTMKSIYANACGVKPTKLNGEKITLFKNRFFTKNLELMSQAQFISFNDMGLNEDLKYALSLRFPNKTKFEAMEIKKSTKEAIIEWLEKGEEANHEEGVKLYCLIGRNKHLMSKFQRNDSEKWREKLRYQLENLVNRSKIIGEKLKDPVDIKKLVEPIQTSSGNEEKEAEKAKKTRVKIIDEDRIKLEALPEELQKLYNYNKKVLTPKIGAIHAELRLLAKEKNKEKLAEFRQKLIDLENERRKNWESIDSWYAINVLGEKANKVKLPVKNNLDLEAIEAIKDADERATLKLKRIDANKRYLARLKQNDSAKKQKEAEKRRIELKKWNVKL